MNKLGRIIPLWRIFVLSIVTILWITNLLNPHMRLVMQNMVISNFPFLDLYCILAAVERHRLGFNPYLDGLFDPMGRSHAYGPWWFVLTPLGIGVKDNIWLGTITSSLAIFVPLFLIKRWNIKSILIFICTCFSPPIMLGLTRGNNDVWILLLLVLSSYLITKKYYLLASGINIVGFGLKFYPLLVAPYPLTFIKRRLLRYLTLLLIIIGALLLWTTWSAIMPKMGDVMAAPTGPWTFGGPGLFRELLIGETLSKKLSLGLGILIVLLISWYLINRDRMENIPAEEISNIRYHLFIQSTVILLATFVLRENYSYRLIFTLGMLPWLLDLYKNNAHRDTITVWLISCLLSLWGEWIFFTTTNSLRLLNFYSAEEFLILQQKFLLGKELFYWVFYALTVYLFCKISFWKGILKSWIKE